MSGYHAHYINTLHFQLFANINDFTSIDQYLADFNQSLHSTTYADTLGITRENVSISISIIAYAMLPY